MAADLVAAEDTRRLRRLLADLGVTRTGPVVSFYEEVERQRLPRLLDVLAAGGTVAVITDAGMPSVSDPGYRAARAALDSGHRVTALPGPSAVTTALAVSGLPCDRFCFEGFVPRRPPSAGPGSPSWPTSRARSCSSSPRTDWPATLADLAAAFGADGRRRSAGSCPRPTRRSCATPRRAGRVGR